MNQIEANASIERSNNWTLILIVITALLSCPFICEAQRGDFARCIEQGWSPQECKGSKP